MQQSYRSRTPTSKSKLPGALKGVGIEQRLDSQIPLKRTIFKDEAGRDGPLSLHLSFHDGKPVVLALVYYRCPMLCTEILNGLEGHPQSHHPQPPGKDFESGGHQL